MLAGGLNASEWKMARTGTDLDFGIPQRFAAKIW
jgi:hypothetical protein